MQKNKRVLTKFYMLESCLYDLLNARKQRLRVKCIYQVVPRAEKEAIIRMRMPKPKIHEVVLTPQPDPLTNEISLALKTCVLDVKKPKEIRGALLEECSCRLSLYAVRQNIDRLRP